MAATVLPRQAAAKAAYKADFPTMIWHTLLLVLMVLGFSSGMRIALDNAKGFGWRTWLEPLLMQGDVIRWHVWIALALCGLVTGYVAFLWRARLKSRWKVYQVALKSPNRRARWQAFNRLLYWAGFFTFALVAVTGIWLYFFPFLGFMNLVGLLHEIGSWTLVAYIVLHALAQFKMDGLRQLLKIFNPRFDRMQAGAAMLVAGVAGAAAFEALDWQATPDFQLVKASEPPILDGRPDDALWQNAPMAQVHTAHGWNVVDGETPVHIRGAVHGNRVYFLAEWKDSTRSYMRMPLQKTESGWKRLKGQYDKSDVTDYYEDKFAIALSDQNRPFGGAWHFGTQPLAGLPKTLQGRGYHYTLDGSYVDVWHWKASRCDPLGQAEDSHFGPPVAFDPQKHKKRYPAGYGGDAKTGGYKENFVEKDGKLVPRYLPKDPAALIARLGGPDLKPTEHHPSHFSMFMDEAVPYSAELDKLPVGTLLPALILESRIQGGAGEVDAAGHWENGWWHVEFSRVFDTGHEDDVAIKDGIYMWFSAFDHNQTRHSWHIIPLRLRLPK